MKFRVTAHILHHNRHFHKILHFTNLLRRHASRLKRVRHRQQIVRVPPIDAAPAEMIRKPRRLRPLHQRLQAPQVLAIQFLRRTEIHRHAVLHHFVLIENLIQDSQRPPAVDHVVLGNNFEPIHHGLARQDVVVVRRPQTNPDPVVCEIVEPVRRHSQLQKKNRCQRLGNTHHARPLTPMIDVTPWARRCSASSNHPSRNHPCPCTSSGPCSRCRSTYIRPCPCRSSDPCKRAFPSPSCLSWTDPACALPRRARRPQRSTPELPSPSPPAIRRELRPRSLPSSTLSCAVSSS